MGGGSGRCEQRSEVRLEVNEEFWENSPKKKIGGGGGGGGVGRGQVGGGGRVGGGGCE